MTHAKASAIRSSVPGSTATDDADGCSAVTAGIRSSLRSAYQKPGGVARRANTRASSGSNQRPLRSATISSASAGPPVSKKISATWARLMMRDSSGIACLRRPSG
jgi:hypothetical protein